MDKRISQRKEKIRDIPINTLKSDREANTNYVCRDNFLS